ncbi:plasmid maintenance protein [Borrelia miyamotoi]|uniref:plasmid maintenance protein n=1 Tax=Borrelia miyamotoi TaxID=47466 RepID=UPI002FBE2803
MSFYIITVSSKKNQVRLIKLISTLKYLNKNKLGYNQQDILNLINFFLKKEGYVVIKIKTLQKDLNFLKKNNIIKTFIIRLGEYKGSKIKYMPKKKRISNIKTSTQCNRRTIRKNIQHYI